MDGVEEERDDGEKMDGVEENMEDISEGEEKI